MRAVFSLWIVVWVSAGLAGPSVETPDRFSVSPDSSLTLLLSALESARSEVLINIYEFSHPGVVEALAGTKGQKGLLQKGVAVRMLIEGEAVQPVTPEGLKALQDVQKAMTAADPSGKRNRIWVMLRPSPDSGQKRRFRFDHAKYVVIDSKRVFVSTDNFVENALPIPGYVGYRGWQARIEDSALAKEFTEMFLSDADPAHPDVRDFRETRLRVTSRPNPVREPRKIAALAVGSGRVDGVELITSPNKPSQNDPAPGGSRDRLADLIRNTGTHVEVEFMSLPKNWETGSESFLDPLVQAILDAALEGVRVRVLLNDERAFQTLSPGASGQKTSNQITVEYFQHVSKCWELSNLHAAIVNLQAAGLIIIHNKGILADDRNGTEYALVSSINGTQNSVMNNREVALLLEGRDASSYYLKAFNADWTVSKEVPDLPSNSCDDVGNRPKRSASHP